MAPYTNPWTPALNRYTRNPAGGAPLGSVVGALNLTFSDARNGSFGWTLGSRSGTEPVQVLLGAEVPAIPDRTGIWYDPLESGWGLSINSTANLRSALVYFYDANRQPRWVLGLGSNAASETVAMQSFRGFCPDCSFAPATAANGGILTLDFIGARVASVRTDVFYAEQPSARWQRGPVAIVPLSDAALNPQLQ